MDITERQCSEFKTGGICCGYGSQIMQVSHELWQEYITVHLFSSDLLHSAVKWCNNAVHNVDMSVKYAVSINLSIEPTNIEIRRILKLEV